MLMCSLSLALALWKSNFAVAQLYALLLGIYTYYGKQYIAYYPKSVIICRTVIAEFR